MLAERSREHVRWRNEKEKSFPGGRLHFWLCLVAILLYIFVNPDSSNRSHHCILFSRLIAMIPWPRSEKKSPDPGKEPPVMFKPRKGSPSLAQQPSHSARRKTEGFFERSTFGASPAQTPRRSTLSNYQCPHSLLPLMSISYMLQFLDKQALSFTSILDLPGDLHLRGDEFAWASGIYYFGYMVAACPAAMLMVRWHVGKTIAISM